jgi:hypothetical protein
MVRPCSAIPLLVVLVGLPLGGCASAWPIAARALAPSEQTVVSPPGEDGTQYLAVEGGPLSSPAGLRSRWGAVARQVCRGDYLTLSEAGVARRQGGVTRRRVHEGYLRCLLPGEREPGAGPTVADATQARPRRVRRANLARSRTAW